MTLRINLHILGYNSELIVSRRKTSFRKGIGCLKLIAVAMKKNIISDIRIVISPFL